VAVLGHSRQQGQLSPLCLTPFLDLHLSTDLFCAKSMAESHCVLTRTTL